MKPRGGGHGGKGKEGRGAVRGSFYENQPKGRGSCIRVEGGGEMEGLSV